MEHQNLKTYDNHQVDTSTNSLGALTEALGAGASPQKTLAPTLQPNTLQTGARILKKDDISGELEWMCLSQLRDGDSLGLATDKVPKLNHTLAKAPLLHTVTTDASSHAKTTYFASPLEMSRQKVLVQLQKLISSML